MPTLGKILLFINLLLGGGLIYVAAQDWAKRQEITATALQYYLIMQGLPVDMPAGDDPDSIPFSVVTSGGHVVESISPKLLNAYFQSASGGEQFGAVGSGTPISTQVAEVRRVKDKADAILSAADARTRLALLVGTPERLNSGWLTALATSYEERNFYHALAYAVAEEVQDALTTAESIFQRKFEAVLATPNPTVSGQYTEKYQEAQEKLQESPESLEAMQEFSLVLADRTLAATSDEGDRRRQITHLLIHLDPSSEWQNRVARVVGLREYQQVVADQATRLQDMARSTQRQMEMDQATFVDQYEQLKLLALERSVLLAEQKVITANLQNQERADDEALKQRSRQLEDRLATLDAARDRVIAQLEAQAKVENALFEVQRRVGNTLQATFDLEKMLESAEQGR